MPLIPYGEYKPDISDYQSTTTKNILNVLPRADGYGPFPDFSLFSGALAAACRGAFCALNTDGSVTMFAGTSTKLYKMDNTTLAWSDVSAGSSTYTALSATAQWRFAQFGSVVIAVQGNAAPQAFTLGSSTEFAALAGSPPNAAYVDVVGRFLVLSGLTSNPFRIHWSGLNAITTWTSGSNSSDYQDLPDGGIVRGVAGGEYGVICQDSAFRRMIYAPGSSVIFQIERISQDIGLSAPYSLVRAGDKVFCYSSVGFQLIDPGQPPRQIGRERVDRTFADELDRTNTQLFMGASDPRASKVYWAYRSQDGASGLYDKIIGYDYVLDKWFKLSMSGEILLSISQPGITLDALDSISSSVDAMTGSLDDYSSASLPEIAQFNSAHKLGFFRGDNLEATLETAEAGTDGRRVRVRGFRPITDAATIYGSCSTRETQQADATAGSEVAIDTRTGRIDLHVSTRYSRYKNRIPAATDWSFAAGVEPDTVQEGKL